ncbi:MAG TPA: TonB family protein [Oleiagrimonas sp.]|nr:TonB family protein [Oleiagrimonas sp.]
MMHTIALCLACACIGLLLTLMLRWSARRLAGPGPAFTLWALPVLLAIMPLLPKQAVPALGSASLTILPALFVQPQAPVAASAGIDVPWPAIWLTGSALVMLRTLLHYLRIRRSTRPLSASLRQAIAPMLPSRLLQHACMHAEGPAVLWSWPCRLLLPPDFIERFDASGRAQVLAHEQTHLARRDPLWSLAAEIVLAALWFFPPAWWAMSRFRLDQELACDAAVLRRAPDQAARYARALVDHCDSGTPLPALNTWFSTSQLKERLTMIQHPHTLLRRPLGYAALAILLAGTALAVQAALPGSVMPSAQEHTVVTFPPSTQAHVIQASRIQNPPRYPPEAIKKHEQGTTVVLIHVDANGKPLEARVDYSSGSRALDQAAAKSAMQWHFKPATIRGKPVKAWTRVPVAFRLNKDDSVHAGRPVSSAEARRPPVYPAEAIKKHEQGTVVLNIHVDGHGKPISLAYDPEASSTSSQSLINAASKAAKQWHFNPATKNGKPVAGWVRVPVKFALPKYNAAQNLRQKCKSMHQGFRTTC